MRFSNKAVSMEMLKMLSSLSYSAFQNYCREIISEVMPYTAASKEMRRLDSAGIDLFLLTDQRNEIEFGFQCKGFEVSHFSESQLKQCLDSISSLEKLDVKVKNYYLIINREVYKEEKEIMEAALADVKKKGMIDAYELLDVRAFINFLSVQITEKFKIALRQSNQKLYDQYRQSLDQRFYYADVPFVLNEKQLARNPSAFLEKSLELSWKGEKDSAAHYEPSKYFFVIGDFGFGKTSLMFQSIQRLTEYNAIYIPLSYFKKRDFQNQLEFVMVINKLVTGEENDIKNLFFKFKSRVLAHLLENDPQLVLLFDGMDENMYLGTLEGLKIFFSLLTPVKVKCIFSMRKTFWEDRNGNFQIALPKGRKHKDRISLSEWDNEHILGFVAHYKKNYGLSDEALRYIEEFEQIVSRNGYQNYYGDIPRRPLFLEMILQDVADGQLKKMSFSELYEKYFFKKFVRDTESSFENIPSGRPSTNTEDVYKGFADICTIMEQVAGLMMDDSQIVVFLNRSIRDSTIEPLLRQYNINNIQILLLNSVLTTTTSRSIQGIQIGFSHLSFQEYFTARYLCREILSQKTGWDITARLVFPDTVYSFIVNYLEWKQREEKIFSQLAWKEVFRTDWPHNSLGDILHVVSKPYISS